MPAAHWAATTTVPAVGVRRHMSQSAKQSFRPTQARSLATVLISAAAARLAQFP